MSANPQTVLIVDDDPQVLRLVEKMLRPRNSVRILLAGGPAEALQICEQGPVHLLISDVSMPGMDGDKLAERVLSLQPQTRVLLISGNFREPSGLHGGRISFLKKPFFPSQLLASITELLPA